MFRNKRKLFCRFFLAVSLVLTGAFLFTPPLCLASGLLAIIFAGLEELC